MRCIQRGFCGHHSASKIHTDLPSLRYRIEDLEPNIEHEPSGGRITEEIVQSEIIRLQQAWRGFQNDNQVMDKLNQYLSPEVIAELDLFDRLQLNQVIEICQSSRSMAEAGRRLFNVSRDKKSSINDSHRLKQYLQKFDLQFDKISHR